MSERANHNRGEPKSRLFNMTGRTREWTGNDQMYVESLLVLILVIATIGLFCNIVCINILRKNIKTQPTSLKLIFGIVVIATVSMLTSTLSFKHIVIQIGIMEARDVVRITINFFLLYLRTAADILLSVLVFLLSVSRLLAMVKPLHVKDYCLVKHLGKTAIGATFVVSLLVLPLGLGPTLRSGSDYMYRDMYLQAYMTTVTVLFHIVLFLLQSIVNITLSVVFAKIVRRNKNLVNNPKLEQAKKLYIDSAIILSIVHILHVLPHLITQILVQLSPEQSRFGIFKDTLSITAKLREPLNVLTAATYGPIFFLTSTNKRHMLMTSIRGLFSKFRKNVNSNTQSLGSNPTNSTTR